MTVYLLPEEPVFPPAEEAEGDGLIAIGGDLSEERLLQAYASGIFPWFMEDDEIYWFSPDPRMVMFPARFCATDSLKRLVRSNRFEVRFDTAFERVIRGCSEAPRPGQDGTWITDDFIAAYIALYERGFAHSVEVYSGVELVGGLYGISLGAAFFGESMFFKINNASKVAFHALVDHCVNHNFKFIDCQVETGHLLGLGATMITRKEYLLLLQNALNVKTLTGKWETPDRRTLPRRF